MKIIMMVLEARDFVAGILVPKKTLLDVGLVVEGSGGGEFLLDRRIFENFKKIS